MPPDGKVRSGGGCENPPGRRLQAEHFAPPFRVAEFDLLYGLGISKESSLLDMAVERDLIQKSGAWFSYKELRIGQGRENARKYLVDNPEVAREIDQIIRSSLPLAKPRTESEDEIATEDE